PTGNADLSGRTWKLRLDIRTGRYVICALHTGGSIVTLPDCNRRTIPERNSVAKRYTALLLVPMLLSGASVWAQTPTDTLSLSLEGAVARAVQGSQEVRLAEAQV